MLDTSDAELQASDVKANLLLVDDREANLLALESILEELGQNLVRARSGEEALRRLLQDDYAAILLDVQMPGLDGFETAQLIRGRRKSRHTPIIFLTAHESNRLSLEQAYSLGAVDYLVKPLVPAILRSKVSGFIELYRKTELVRRQAELLREHERREANEALRASEARKSAILQAALDAIITMDAQGRIVEFNPAAETLFGYPRGAVLGRDLADLLIPRAWQERHRRGLAHYLASGEGPILNKRLEMPARRADGSEFWVELAIAPLDGGGQPLFTGFLQDISERRRMQEQLRRARENLETRVRERTADLAAANAALQRSNQELEQFASVASHDLQEPLRKIQAFGDRLQARCAEQLSEQGRDYLERMRSAASRMRTLINDLLTFARVTTRGQPFVEVDLAVEVEQVISDLESRLQQTGGRVEIGPLPTVRGDPTQMRQLLQNLLVNALKFHRPDEPPVVRVEGRLVPNGQADEASFCEIAVQDNGIGFDEKYLDRIFQLFQRLHSRGDYEGTGLGLAICRKIVERHGGTLTARSVPGQGSTFLVTLPVQPNGEPAA